MCAKKIINTIENDKRTSTQNLMQEIWNAINNGCTDFEINACGQHNIGGSVWSRDGSDLNFYLTNPGQRVGAMGAKGTNIYVEGSAPADTGWLNSGAKIVVNGDSGDTTGHCAASGKIYIECDMESKLLFLFNLFNDNKNVVEYLLGKNDIYVHLLG